MARRNLMLARPPAIAGFASVLADPSRVAMLDVLLDGEPHPIGQLARRARITPATASSHLARLVDARLVSVAQVGRERRVTLASAQVAELLERLAGLAAPATPAHDAHPQLDRLRFARTCYDHLAGFLGVVIATRLVERGWLHRTTDNFEPSSALLDWLADRGQPVSTDPQRPLSRACLDWTEREPHLAGRTGAALARVFLAERWVARLRDSRALRLTAHGRTMLADELDARIPGPA